MNLRSLQKQCLRAFRMYTDLSDAVCDLLTERDCPMDVSDQARLAQARKQECAAFSKYVETRGKLMAALVENQGSVQPKPVQRASARVQARRRQA